MDRTGLITVIAILCVTAMFLFYFGGELRKARAATSEISGCDMYVLAAIRVGKERGTPLYVFFRDYPSDCDAEGYIWSNLKRPEEKQGEL
jgi:hypothetical protein